MDTFAPTPEEIASFKKTETRASFEDFKEKLRHWMREYNNFPMKPLKWLSPNQKLAKFQA